MKRIFLVSLMLIPFAVSSSALDKAELDAQIRKIQNKFEAMQANPEKRVPADMLRKAQAIIMLDRTKAGFIFAFEGGGGVALAKNGDAWSAPAFYKANEASLGFQIGGQQSFVVILLMSTNATRYLTESMMDVGGEASGTAGGASASEQGKISPTEPSVLVYDERKGLYGGAALKGGAIKPDEKANWVYYGYVFTPREILFERKAKPSERAIELAGKLNEQAKASK